MSAIYDNWERLVAAAVKKQQLWELFHAQSRSPSILSEASDFSSSFNSNHYLNDPAFDFSIPGSLSVSQRVLSKLVLISDFSRAFDAKDVFLESAELLGRGTFGSAYKVTMKSGGTIVVKILKSASVSEQDFKRHMEFIASVRHENVAPLRAYYSSKDERLMLYDYHGKGSVHTLLHGKTGTRVDWETRLRIAIGAARGIAKIHSQNGGTLVHGNIKSSNIFLDPQHYGCISDLGLANMIKTLFLPAARCYAPEIKNTQNVSQASDVFSFGILLLELLTRKSPVHLAGGHKAVDLVKLTSSAKSKEKVAKVFDADLLEHPSIREQMVKMLQTGVKCVAKSVKKRPEMYEVVRMLEDIIKMDLGNPINPISSVKGKLVFVGDVYPSFDLEDMLSASAEALGKGTFGSSFKAEFGDYTIRVKRLRHVNVTGKEFQQHIEVIDGVKHQNIPELIAYYFSKDEKLLVYDYYNQGSVSALLHGSSGIPLEWETRLKIAVGAARGIAHLHAQVGLNLKHGNIKSSNIFINEQKYGIVADAGMTALTAAIKISDMATRGYCAPEVKDTKKVSQASDVYSFGVFLLELLSGKQSQHTTDDGETVSLVDWVQSVVGNEWTAEVFDVKLVRYGNEEAMEQVLQLAMSCVASLPELRPRMLHVVKMLEEISGVENELRVDDLWGRPSIESSLEDLLEDLLPTLTP